MTNYILLFWGFALLGLSWEGIKYLKIHKKEILVENGDFKIPVFGVGTGNGLLWNVSTWGRNQIIFKNDEIIFLAPEEVNDTGLKMQVTYHEIQCIDKGVLPWGNLTFERKNSGKIRTDYQVWFANKKILTHTLKICQEKGIPLSKNAQIFLSKEDKT